MFHSKILVTALPPASLYKHQSVLSFPCAQRITVFTRQSDPHSGPLSAAVCLCSPDLGYVYEEEAGIKNS